MLGSALTKFLTSELIQVWEFNRTGKPIISGNNSRVLDVTNEASLEDFLKTKSFDFVINGIGLIKQLIRDGSEEHMRLAYQINSDFPAILNNYSQENSTPVIQIGTDCVYSGDRGSYDETSNFDCSDIYGLSKVDGEKRSKSLMTLRTSIVGHELNSSISLMDWFSNLKLKSHIQGYTNHFWNGVTTLEFSKIVGGIISSGTFEPGTLHVVPADRVSKYELLCEFRQAFERLDVSIEPHAHETSINRTLSTVNPEKNSRLWTLAGYNDAPTVHEMIQRYAH
jgi:dTDP-4-dehydrorhamnose reductase